MARSFIALMAFAAIAMAAPQPITPDPNGDKNVGNGQGLQFITGGCLSTADCSQAVVQSCCAFIAGGASTGICSGAAVGDVNGKAGCGFGDGGSSTGSASTAAASTPAVASTTTSGSTGSADQCSVDSSLPGSQSVGTGSGTQFITGQCFSAADCQSGCCVEQASGPALCKAQTVTQEAGLTCDFSCSGSTSSSSSSDSTSTSSSSDTVVSQPATNVAATTSGGTCPAIDDTLPGSQNVGTGSGTQFITGQCFTSADCASGCCVLQSDGISLCKAQLVTEEAGLTCDSSCTGGAASSSSSSTSSSSNAGSSSTASTGATTGAAGSAQCTVDSSLAGSQNVGTGSATQFITGQCFSSADCASGCCVEQASGAALCKAQLVTTQAGLSCDFTCSA
ncbi:hypothetical protein Sste5346_007941 [Sporothrix stenoceras]|uniref:Biotrophy-associated secreted protein 2 n=1 Tax=Sporothrix stenoceras TaxID=5173 RepID=A0ABR3YUD0_9PEZI